MASNGSPRGEPGRPTGADWTAWLTDSVLYASANRPKGAGSPHVASDQLRVSDAERSQVADVLSRHYGEGRLDSEELNERLEKAMGAKTRGELKPLLADLPEEMPAPVAGPPGRRHGGRGLLERGFPAALAVLILVALLLALVTVHHIGGFFLIAALAFVYLRRRHYRARRRWHSHLHRHNTPHWHSPSGPVLADPNSAPPKSF